MIHQKGKTFVFINSALAIFVVYELMSVCVIENEPFFISYLQIFLYLNIAILNLYLNI